MVAYDSFSNAIQKKKFLDFRLRPFLTMLMSHHVKKNFMLNINQLSLPFFLLMTGLASDKFAVPSRTVCRAGWGVDAPFRFSQRRRCTAKGKRPAEAASLSPSPRAPSEKRTRVESHSALQIL